MRYKKKLTKYIKQKNYVEDSWNDKIKIHFLILIRFCIKFSFKKKFKEGHLKAVQWVFN